MRSIFVKNDVTLSILVKNDVTAFDFWSEITNRDVIASNRDVIASASGLV